MLRGILTVGGWTLISRVLGFARDMIFAAVLGAGPVADAFLVALRLPNLFRRLFGEGAFNAAFVPEFSGLLATEGEAAAHRFAEQAVGVLAFWLIAITILGEIFMPQLMLGLAYGFRHDVRKFALAVTLSRITFPYLPLICLAALASGVLNGMHRFAAAAIAPVVYNIVSIAFMLFLTPYVPTAGHAFALGISVSGVAQLALLMWAVSRTGMGLLIPRPRLSPAMRVLLRRMVPGLIGAGVMQINQMVDVVILSFLPTGTMAIVYYANQVQQLPLAIIGTAVGTALLPLLSRQVRGGAVADAEATTNRALEYALFLTLPAAIALVAMPHPVIATLFQRGRFTAMDSLLSAQSLTAYALGLPAFVLVKVLAPGFFARGDTSTPVRIGIGCVAFNFALNIALMRPLQHMGPPLATSISAWVQLALLGRVLRRRGQLSLDPQFRRRAPRMALAAGGMGLALWGMSHTLWSRIAHAPGGRYVGLALLVGFGAIAFFAIAGLIGAFDRREMLAMLRRRRAPA